MGTFALNVREQFESFLEEFSNTVETAHHDTSATDSAPSLYLEQV